MTLSSLPPGVENNGNFWSDNDMIEQSFSSLSLLTFFYIRWFFVPLRVLKRKPYVHDSRCHSRVKGKRDKKRKLLASLVNTMSTSINPNLSRSDSIPLYHTIQALKWKEREQTEDIHLFRTTLPLLAWTMLLEKQLSLCCCCCCFSPQRSRDWSTVALKRSWLIWYLLFSWLLHCFILSYIPDLLPSWCP